MRIALVLFCLVMIATASTSYGQTHVVGAAKTYRYWTGEEPDSTIKVLNGEYWSYGHFTKEYKMYMELKIRPARAKYFITDNNLRSGKYEVPGDAPKWFKPPKSYEVWNGKQGSIYYINTKTGHMYMYEIQL